MARRKLSDNHVEELEYRLLALLRQKNAYGPAEIRIRYAGIVGLASLWNIDLDKYHSIANVDIREKVRNPYKNETPAEGGPTITSETPLTIPSGGSIFDELENDPNDEKD